jgi:hypothetical protein
MSERAVGFVDNWISENIHADGMPVTDRSQAAPLAAACRAAARQEGISDAEIDEAFDDLAAFIAGQIEEAADREHDDVEDDDRPEDVRLDGLRPEDVDTDDDQPDDKS